MATSKIENPNSIKQWNYIADTTTEVTVPTSDLSQYEELLLIMESGGFVMATSIIRRNLLISNSWTLQASYRTDSNALRTSQYNSGTQKLIAANVSDYRALLYGR